MALGRYMQGDEVTLRVLARDASDAPQVPADAPTAQVWLGSTLVWSGKLPPMDAAAQAGLFSCRLFLGAAFGQGRYRVVYLWRVGAFCGLDADAFDVIPGGDPDGAVIAMHYWRCPHADYVVQQLESGRVVRGKNPRV